MVFNLSEEFVRNQTVDKLATVERVQKVNQTLIGTFRAARLFVELLVLLRLHDKLGRSFACDDAETQNR